MENQEYPHTRGREGGVGMVSLIACMSKNRAIGYQNQLIYHIDDDMRRFVSYTRGHTIIMGRKTFESLPHGALPHRRNMVISHSRKHICGCETFCTIEDALAHCSSQEDIFVIGGASIYQQMLPLAHHLYLTLVDDIPQSADAFFPEIDEQEWETMEQEDKHEGKWNYRFVHMRRKSASI